MRDRNDDAKVLIKLEPIKQRDRRKGVRYTPSAGLGENGHPGRHPISLAW